MLNYRNAYTECTLCPRMCRVDRTSRGIGFCGMTDKITVASAVLHRGEEPPLIGAEGSGAVFFTGCTLGCPFCQNIQISGEKMGSELSIQELAELFLKLQEHGAANINLVTASQFIPSIIDAVNTAKTGGLELPVMWNTSGWERKETLELLSETVDIWLPDMKTLNPKSAEKLFSTPDYPVVAEAALIAMAEQVEGRGGMLVENGIMKRGMIVRHLVIPGELESSIETLGWFAEKLADKAFLSLMVQYTPVDDPVTAAGTGYRMSDDEYEQLLERLNELDIDEGFLQEPEAASPEWIPDFSRLNPFPDEYSKPIWHFQHGYIK